MPRTPSRDPIDSLTSTLLDLHRALLDDTRQDYERIEGPVGGPGDLLALLTQHATFAWLRPLSGLIAELEHAGAAGDEDAVREHVAKLDELLAPGSAFAARTVVVFQRSPDAVMAHAAALRALRATGIVTTQST